MSNQARTWNISDKSRYVPEDGGPTLLSNEAWELPPPPAGYKWWRNSSDFSYLQNSDGITHFWLVKLAHKPFGYVSGVFGEKPRHQVRSLDPIAALTVTMARARMTL